jgi:hypothetical protein
MKDRLLRNWQLIMFFIVGGVLAATLAAIAHDLSPVLIPVVAVGAILTALFRVYILGGGSRMGD